MGGSPNFPICNERGGPNKEQGGLFFIDFYRKSKEIPKNLIKGGGVKIKRGGGGSNFFRVSNKQRDTLIPQVRVCL